MQSGDPGHPRAPARLGLCVAPLVDSIPQNLFKLGNPTGHRQMCDLAFSIQHGDVRTLADDHGHPRASARVGSMWLPC
eukprot:8708210-Pyramimonas_sp.AAC.1